MYTAKTITHKGKERIAVYFDNDATLIARFKKLGGAQWSATLKVWHLPDTAENRLKFKIAEEEMPVTINREKVKEIEVFETYLNTKRYSCNTVKTYTEALKSFLKYFDSKPINTINNIDVIDYHQHYILKNKLSSSYQNQIINAIKLYFSIVKETAIVVAKIYTTR